MRGRRASVQPSRAFDLPHYQRLIDARGRFLLSVLQDLKGRYALETAVDAGCGIGFFSAMLQQLGFRVLAFDARQENVDEARRRHSDISFQAADVENPTVQRLGTFDLALCFGLLYHLENPFLAIRNLYTLTGRILLLESICVPQGEPALFLRDERHCEDQGLNYVALYPSEGALIKMCYRAGFPFVYRFLRSPDHEDFRSCRWAKRRRTVLAASKLALNSPLVALVREPSDASDLWNTHWAQARQAFGRLVRFIRKPWREKLRSVTLRWVRTFPGVLIPVRLPFGVWWLAEDGFGGTVAYGDGFEKAERRFVERFLQPGMTVLDVGAHSGFYTLLASRRVGSYGRVVAFEPSPRERKKLFRHLRLNRCTNVEVEPHAIANCETEADFFLVRGRETGCNSLRPPAVTEPTELLRVSVTTLDGFIERQQMERVDFIKVDVEGAELDVFRGAARLLQGRPRPVILAEVYDIRTAAWGYRARDIVAFLHGLGYRWFQPLDEGSLAPVSVNRERFDANFVAFPEERMNEVSLFGPPQPR
jgi:FkbM family methyltransferase